MKEYEHYAWIWVTMNATGQAAMPGPLQYLGTDFKAVHSWVSSLHWEWLEFQANGWGDAWHRALNHLRKVSHVTMQNKTKNQLKPTVSHINWGFILLSKTETQQTLLTWDDPECEERMKRSGTRDFWDGKYCNPLTRTFGFHFSPVLSIKLLKFSVSILV